MAARVPRLVHRLSTGYPLRFTGYPPRGSSYPSVSVRYSGRLGVDGAKSLGGVEGAEPQRWEDNLLHNRYHAHIPVSRMDSVPTNEERQLFPFIARETFKKGEEHLASQPAVISTSEQRGRRCVLSLTRLGDL
jgi:hypothetical protein